MAEHNKFPQPINIVAGYRTPFLKTTGKPNHFSAADLALQAGRNLLTSLDFDPTQIDETILGCVMPSEDEANIGRILGLRLGCGIKTPGWTVQRNCGSAMQALDSAMKDIWLGRADVVLAGGTEAMSRAPLILNEGMANWLAGLQKAKGKLQKLKHLSQLKAKDLKPIIALIHGLTDPVCGMNMGQTAELVAYDFKITRDELDRYSLRSHQRLAKAYDDGYMTEVKTVYDLAGQYYAEDTGLRRDTTLEKLAHLKPTFDKYGIITAGNSSQITDGAALMMLASDEGVKKHNLPVLARITDVNWAALDPRVMSLGPVYATTPMLLRNKLKLDDIDYWEINEAFAATVIGCKRAWESDDFCKRELNLDKALGHIDDDKLNIDGGAIAIGHPVGATGARIVMHVVEVLRRKQLKRGVATLCIGGGQGGAMLIETME